MGIDARMFVRHQGCLNEFQVRRISAQLVKRLGSSRFGIYQEPKYGSRARHALEIIEDGIYTQDGYDIVAGPGEQFVACHIWTRYYGEGYERGDWPFISVTAALLEAHIPGGQVWYGGDSSGVCAEHLTRARREELTLHWLTQGHEPYRAYSMKAEASLLCDFCGDIPMHATGGGPSDDFWSCDGCGLELIRDKVTRAVYHVADPDHKLSGHFSGRGKPYVRRYEWDEQRASAEEPSLSVASPVLIAGSAAER